MLIFITLLSYYYYDSYSDIRKRFRWYRNTVPEEFEMKRGSFIIYGPSNSGKTTFIKEYCSLYGLLMYSVVMPESGKNIIQSLSVNYIY